MQTDQVNFRLRQVLTMIFIAFLAILILQQLYVFLPGFLGAITFYILSRDLYFRLTEKKKWRKN